MFEFITSLELIQVLDVLIADPVEATFSDYENTAAGVRSSFVYIGDCILAKIFGVATRSAVVVWPSCAREGDDAVSGWIALHVVFGDDGNGEGRKQETGLGNEAELRAGFFGGGFYSLFGYSDVVGGDVDSDEMAVVEHCHFACGSGAAHGV